MAVLFINPIAVLMHAEMYSPSGPPREARLAMALVLGTLAAASGAMSAEPQAAVLPPVSGVELQPLTAQIKRLEEALEALGAPLSAQERAALDAAIEKDNESSAEDLRMSNAFWIRTAWSRSISIRK